MSIFGSDDLARTRNVLYTDPDTVPTTTGTGTGERGPMGPQGATGPQGPQGPQGNPGVYIGIFNAVNKTGINLLGTTAQRTLVYTVPSSKRFIIQDFTILLTSVSGSEKTTLPTVRLYKSSSLSSSIYQLTNQFDFNAVTTPAIFAAGYVARVNVNSTTTIRPTATSGESIYFGIDVAFDGTGQTTPYTTMQATCIVAGYEL